MQTQSGRNLNWSLIHEGFPGLGHQARADGRFLYTIRPSTQWRAQWDLRREDLWDGGTVHLGSSYSLTNMQDAARTNLNHAIDHDIRERCREEIQASGSC